MPRAEAIAHAREVRADAAHDAAGQILDGMLDLTRAVGHLRWIRQPISDGLLRTYLDQAATALDLGLNLCLMAREQLQAARRGAD